ncbi:histidine kinase [Bosea sp. (in: a-proteobacteria)]|uniref:histidine kinase n=1 Tax=Bosea sp. (in: a-proteobacteria) TaxID=1871050 RepID=UPI002624E824|nr:histidine kinase [Bosea sp. (in: a-proteobacteria)]MCO5091416.1 histidine kinase [Bosea sp. (in: a-proteobacteria)]
MADFYPILARAVAGLPDPSPEARRAIYERARTALVAQLRGLDPPLSEAEIMRERLALDEAVARIEADHDEAPAPAPAAEGPVIRTVEAPLLPIRPPAPKKPPEFAPLPAAAGQEEGEPLPEPAEPQAARPRLQPPREPRVKPGHVRSAIVGGVVAVAVAAIAATAIYVHKLRPQDTPRPNGETASQQQPQAPQPDNGGKIAERVGEPGAPPQNRPAGNQPGGAPGIPVPQPGGEIAVAQRAVLFVEVPETPQQPQTANGRVFWRLDSESAGQGRPIETIVRATVEIPDLGLSLDFTIRRNTDPALPASHIIGLRFSSTGDPATQTVKEVGVPQFKTEEGERGAPLSAINSALGDNLFVAALSNVPVEVERNVDLILNRSWIDVPVRFASGRRGIITFEKGVSGSQTLADAFGRWQ